MFNCLNTQRVITVPKFVKMQIGKYKKRKRYHCCITAGVTASNVQDMYNFTSITNIISYTLATSGKV